jgi:DNA polymerase III subunit epsilon
MLDWLKNINKEYPEFWKKYLSTFDTKTKRFVVVSTETTGLSETDVILTIGAVAIIENCIIVEDCIEILINQDVESNDSESENEFLKHTFLNKISETEAVEKFIDYVKNAILVGHRIHFDVEIINKILEKLKCGKLKNEALDIEVMYKKLHDINDRNFTIDELLKSFKLSKSERFSSCEDAYSIALLFLKLKSKLGIS